MNTPKLVPISVALYHRTVYTYDRPTMLGPHIVRLRPAPHTRATILAYSLTVLPEAHAKHWFQDPQGNRLARILFPDAAASFEMIVRLEATLAEANPFDFVLDPEVVMWPFRYTSLDEPVLLPYRQAGSIQPWLAGVLSHMNLAPQPSVDLLVGLNQLIFQRIAYVTRMEPGVQEPEQTCERGSGSCRDVAWLLVQVTRSLGFAARFVSGYLIELATPDERERGVGTDSAGLHAWAEVYLPGAGWIGFDATSGLMTEERHIPLAASSDPAAAAPVTGTVERDTASRFAVETTVERVDPTRDRSYAQD